MKAELIQPGSIVALRMCGATAQTIRDGTRAIPALVLGVGKYRKQNQRWCGTNSIVEVEPEHQLLATTYVAVLRPDIRHWNPRATPVQIDSETSWVLDLVQPGQCYPWMVFDLAYQDYRMAVAERDAWAQRAGAIRRELEALVHEHLAELIAEQIITPDHLSLQWRWKSRGDELEAKLSFGHPDSPKDTSNMLRFEGARTRLSDWLMKQRPQLIEEHRVLMSKIERCRL